LVFAFFNISGGEIFIIMLVVFLIFGPDKIPEIARWLGKGVGEIKKATSEIRDEIDRGTGDIRKEAENLKQDLHVDNPLKKKPVDDAEGANANRNKTKTKDADPDRKDHDPHL
jgi:sec-independent protein translocase protein TatA